MKTIFVKELRENARWAALMALTIAGAMANALNVSASQGESIVSAPFLATTAKGFALCGLTLGLLQVLQDARRGRREFVFHRPISRTRIFAGKIAAGVLLYLLAAGVAFGAAVLWSATPGRVAGPFEWHMALPGTVDLLTGLVWYAAGLLVGMRPARWIGSRLLPLGAAFGCSLVVTGLAISVTQALLIIAAGFCIVLPTAWSSFVSAGQYERQPLIARAMQTICVGAGVSLALIAAASLVSESIRMITRYEPPNIGVQYFMDPNYQLYRITYSTTGSTEVADMSGHVLPPTEAKMLMARQLELYYFLLGEPSSLPWATRLRLQSYRRAGAYIQRLATQSLSAGLSNLDVSVTERPFNLFYIVHRRTIEGYDLQFRRRILGVGPDGFSAGGQLPQPFPQPLRRLPLMGPQTWLLASATDAWRLTLPEIKHIHQTSPDNPILDIGAFPPGQEIILKPRYITVVTKSAIHIYRPGGGAVRLPIEHGPPQCPMVQVAHNGDRYIAWYTQPAGDSQTSWIVEADERGNIARRMEIPPHPTPAVKPAPMFNALELTAYPPIFKLPRVRGDAAGLAATVFTALASAAAACAICKRSAFGWRAALTWTILGLLFGWAAPITLICVRERPARVRCPGCSRRRVVTRALCEHCGAEFDPPQPEGIEIFQSDKPSEVNHATMALGVG